MQLTNTVRCVGESCLYGTEREAGGSQFSVVYVCRGMLGKVGGRIEFSRRLGGKSIYYFSQDVFHR